MLCKRFTRWCPFFWIGAKADRVNRDFRWVDGSPLTFTNWANGQPDELMNWMAPTACNAIKIYVNDGKWQDEPCFNTYTHVVCEKDKGVTN